AIKIEAPDLPVQVITSLNADEIEAIAKGAVGLTVENGKIVDGLTLLPDIKFDPALEVSGIKEPGHIYLWPSLMVLKLSFRQPIFVYINRDHPAKTCRYNVIRAHEFEHAQFDLDGYKHLIGYVTAALKEHALDIAVSGKGESQRDVEKAIGTEITRSVQAAIDRAYAEMRAINASIDTDANYTRMDGLCRK
ncbi:MAG: hypothetical protein ABWY00_05145, partial [Dongiaceae bacterium]